MSNIKGIRQLKLIHMQRVVYGYLSILTSLLRAKTGCFISSLSLPMLHKNWSIFLKKEKKVSESLGRV